MLAFAPAASETGADAVEVAHAAAALGLGALVTAFPEAFRLISIAGALYVHQQQGLAVEPFLTQRSLDLFSMVVIGGLGSLPGAVLGAVYVRGADFFLPLDWQFLATGVGLLAAAVGLAALFVLVESRAGEPIIPLELFRHWTFTGNILFAMIMGVAMFGGLIYLPIYLQAVKGMSATESGLAMLPLVLGIFSTSTRHMRQLAAIGSLSW